ncbi:hypothetical protein MKP05_18330 [Halomonas sp. EGI 63088]|uniref:Uncharacterized protein n=1 Tax=Halomonas flagellata TaxID=2920385 RepID=A0ABS9RZ13_9GAMM|nr:hypothetical protein [Halomonas flagellata]MCH4565059.1 hypothetical protein [Halomonas flagellata]
MSDVTTTDPWQMIFDRAGELGDAILREQPKSKFDLIDYESQVIGMIKEISGGRINPRDDWSVIMRPVNKENKLDEKIESHFHIALRQTVFVRVLFEYHMEKIKENYAESSQPGALMKVGEEMLSAFACAQQHATAWRLLKEVRDKSYETRSQSANQTRAERKKERELLLRCLIETSLDRLRPAGPTGGWRSHILAGQVIAKDLSSMAESYSLPIITDEDELSEKVQLMIWKEPRLRKAYNESAKEPLKEPIKTRKAVLKFGLLKEEE